MENILENPIMAKMYSKFWAEHIKSHDVVKDTFMHPSAKIEIPYEYFDIYRRVFANWRAYHNFCHIKDMLTNIQDSDVIGIEVDKLNPKDEAILKLSILFHDVICGMEFKYQVESDVQSSIVFMLSLLDNLDIKILSSAQHAISLTDYYTKDYEKFTFETVTDIDRALIRLDFYDILTDNVERQHTNQLKLFCEYVYKESLFVENPRIDVLAKRFQVLNVGFLTVLAHESPILDKDLKGAILRNMDSVYENPHLQKLCE